MRDISFPWANTKILYLLNFGAKAPEYTIMSNTISQFNNSFSPGANPEMFSRPIDYSEGNDARVNAFETVPGPEQLNIYAGRNGSAIDPQHSEAALSAVADVFRGASPEAAPAPTAIEQSQIYAPMVVSLRDRVLGTAEEN